MKTKSILLIALLSTAFPLLAQKSYIMKEGNITYIVRDSLVIENPNNKISKNRGTNITDKLHVSMSGKNGYNKEQLFGIYRSIFSKERCKEFGKLRLKFYLYINGNGEIIEIAFWDYNYKKQFKSRPYENIKLSELKAFEEAMKKQKTWDVQWEQPKYKNSNRYAEIIGAIPFELLYPE